MEKILLDLIFSKTNLNFECQGQKRLAIYLVWEPEGSSHLVNANICIPFYFSFILWCIENQ
jgi:hypothetical protein